MVRKNFIQVFEYQKLRVGESGFKEKHFLAMVKFNEKNSNKFFTPIYNGIQFNSYVGVIRIDKLTLEILPKADRDFLNTQEQKDLWQNILLRMLVVCKHINVDTVSDAFLKKKHNSILDVYLQIYLQELNNLVKKGLIRKYRRTKNNQLALKGKLLFSEHINKNLVHKERFYCEHQVYDKNHLIHQILLKGLLILSKLVDGHMANKVKQMLFEFESINQIEINKSHFDRVRLNRKSHEYKKALNIAKMLILNFSPSINIGTNNMLTLLFNMNRLWEEFIYKTLQKYKSDEFEVIFQNSDLFWEHKSIKPDIVIKSNFSSVTFIIDTKWKIIDSNDPSDDDLKQMFTYNLHWSSTKSLLLYPYVNQKDGSFGNYHYNAVNTGKLQCKVGFTSLVDSGEMKKGEIITKEIFSKFGV